jgi:uncharacterized protein (DUF2236 family)
MDFVRDAIAEAIRSRVAGPDGVERMRAVVEADGPRWFADHRPIRAVHSDAAMFVGGVRALLLQSLHPLAMAGVAQHSDYRHDPWGRLQRTADFLGITTFGTASQAEQACETVKAVHRRVRGVASDGRPYEASDPHLMLWVHVAEMDSFLAAYRRYGRAPLSDAEADGYVADMARVAKALDIPSPPRNVDSLRHVLASYRPELRSTPEARAAARFLLFPPIPLAARGPYGLLTAAAVSLLPWWARLQLRLPVTPIADRALVQPAGRALVDVMRWALTRGSPHRASA